MRPAVDDHFQLAGVFQFAEQECHIARGLSAFLGERVNARPGSRTVIVCKVGNCQEQQERTARGFGIFPDVGLNLDTHLTFYDFRICELTLFPNMLLIAYAPPLNAKPPTTIPVDFSPTKQS